MNKKIVGIFIMMLLTATSFLSLVSGSNSSEKEFLKIKFEIIDLEESNSVTDVTSNLNENSLKAKTFTADIFERQRMKKTFTARWDPPNPSKVICIWAQNLPDGATFPDKNGGCKCGYGEVSGTLVWRPKKGQAGKYTFTIQWGENCYEMSNFATIVINVHQRNQPFKIQETQHWMLFVTAYYDPPEPEKNICLWVDENTLPYGASCTECHCDYGSVTSTLEWTPSNNQADDYQIVFNSGETCGVTDFSFPVNVTVIDTTQIDYLMFYQTDYLQGVDSVINSDWGSTFLDGSLADIYSYNYFNLVVNDDWQIQNGLIWTMPEHFPEYSFNFNLGNELGEDIKNVDYVATLTDSPLEFKPIFPSVEAYVMDRFVTVGGLDGRLGPIPSATSLIGWIPIDWAFNDGISNQECGVDECVPAAFSNSLKWLDDNNEEVEIPDNLKSIDGLKEPTGWDAPDTDSDGNPIPGTGGTGVNAWEGKRDALKAHSISTDYYNPVDIDKVIDEIKKGQDVELWGHHHAAVVKGIVKHLDGTYTIYVQHDTAQGKDDEGCKTEPITYDPSTGILKGGAPGFFGGYIIRGFVVECPKVNNPPEKPETPSGETSGKTGTTYPYTTNTIDPDGDEVKYGWDWDEDGIVDEWTDFKSSGIPISTSHKWDDDYEGSIKVIAKDTYGLESEWSDPLKVIMPKNKAINVQLFLQKFFQHFPFFEKILSQII